MKKTFDYVIVAQSLVLCTKLTGARRSVLAAAP